MGGFSGLAYGGLEMGFRGVLFMECLLPPDMQVRNVLICRLQWGCSV